MAYGDFKGLTRRTASGKILRDKAFNIAKIRNMTAHKEVLVQRFINSLIEKFLVAVLKCNYFKQKLNWGIPQINY